MTTVAQERLHFCPKCGQDVELECTLFSTLMMGKFNLKEECPKCHVRLFRFLLEGEPLEGGGSIIFPEGTQSRMPKLDLFLTKDKKLRCMLCLTEPVPKLFALDGVGLVCEVCFKDSDVREAARQGNRIQAEAGRNFE